MPKIEVLRDSEISERIQMGALAPYDEIGPGFRVIDCGDERPLTEGHILEHSSLRDDDPARFYGAASGLAIVAITHLATPENAPFLRNFGRIHTAEGFVDFASDLAKSAKELDSPVTIFQHSADANEGTDTGLADHKTCDAVIGCAFAHNLGFVVHSSAFEESVKEARDIASAVGIQLPIDEALLRIERLGEIVPSDLSVHRGALHHAQTRGAHPDLPIAMHTGSHFPNHSTAVVFDFVGFKANANRAVEVGVPRYHHSVDIPSIILPEILPDFSFEDVDVLRAISLLYGTATRRALSGQNTPHALRVEAIVS